MIIEISIFVLGVFFGLFLPGYLISKILFEKLEVLERIAFSVGFSIGIDIFIGIFLGANETMKDMTGGVTRANVWICVVFVSFFFLFVLGVKILLQKIKSG